MVLTLEAARYGLRLSSGAATSPPSSHAAPPPPSPSVPSSPSELCHLRWTKQVGLPPATPVLPRRPLRLHPVAGFPPSPYPPA
ncbi:hypothetical protein HanRHA438_Chr09g0422791 [Helianthus annuus]|nr:hypothetical protein HanRHA438_Chr09g0422791 [Helianthus annuus]